ncbi:MAG TPA: DsbA family protein [Tepidisphaeraceae bacterium]|nr:DsbA family protein [Tepidisphaeraceae bacterium]
MPEISHQPLLVLPVSEPRDHVLGSLKAPAVLVEYGDYQCPYCRHARHTVQYLRDQMGDQLCFVFRHFPLSQIHEHAQRAAEAAEAAGAQGRFWPMHEMLFDHQENLDDASLADSAAELGLDINRFNAELVAGNHAARVREDFMSGVRSGVNGTPTFFINGLRYDGFNDVESLMSAIVTGMALPPHARHPSHSHRVSS